MPATESKYRGTTLYDLVYAELVTAARYTIVRADIDHHEIAQSIVREPHDWRAGAADPCNTRACGEVHICEEELC